MAYFITFTCYGSHLHGAELRSVDRDHNVVGSRYVAPDARWLAAARGRMAQAAYVLDEHRRRTVLDAIRQVCAHRAWTLIAAHVRTNHVHVVVGAGIAPEAVMRDFKAYASRLLNEREGIHTKRWTRHGSTQYLWKREDVERAVRYVVEGQGDAMAAYMNTAP